MQAVYIQNYGGVDQFQFGDLPEPSIKQNEVLVEVHASSVNPVDYKVRNGSIKLFSGKKFPKILGTDFSGTIVKAGESVTKFQAGDAVFGAVHVLFGKNGGNAEFVAAPQNSLALIPEGLSFEEAAAIPVAGTTAYHNLKNLNIRPGDKVLVNGASGGVGSFALQIAKLFGAEVTAVCSEKNFEFVKMLGADNVIDYHVEDFTMNDIKYNVIYDAYAHVKYGDVKNSLADKGIMLTPLPTPAIMIKSFMSKLFGGKKIIMANANYADDNLITLASWIVENKLILHIDKTFQLEDLAEAHEQLERGGGKGKLVVIVK
ncbi:NAD(P)-dependent alcohol dehydrogenase [Bacteroidota bacterium]